MVDSRPYAPITCLVVVMLGMGGEVDQEVSMMKRVLRRFEFPLAFPPERRKRKLARLASITL